ncbi:hypothetical protein CDAR_119771, partial [Caerostris darwini]
MLLQFGTVIDRIVCVEQGYKYTSSFIIKINEVSCSFSANTETLEDQVRGEFAGRTEFYVTAIWNDYPDLRIVCVVQGVQVYFIINYQNPARAYLAHSRQALKLF